MKRRPEDDELFERSRLAQPYNSWGEPPPLDPEVLEAVTADDRAWFEAHPLENERLRSAVPGEADLKFGLPAGWAWFVEVTKVGDDTRTRQFRAMQRWRVVR